MLQSELKKFLNYNPLSGIFTWRKSTNTSIKIGSIAGSLNQNGYINIVIKKKSYKAHRLAVLYMTGSMPSDHIDHENHIRSDNRFINLKDVSQHENNKNASKRKDNKSGVTGIIWNKKYNKWQSRITVNKKLINLGLFEIFSDAINARMNAEALYGFHKNHGK